MTMRFSFWRLWAVMVKEFIQMRRDKATFAIMIGIPLIQLILFGYAINSDPRHLPTAIVNADKDSPYSREILMAMQNSSYFKFISPPVTEQQSHELIRQGKVQFVVNFPVNFSHDLVKGLKPSLLLQADATDPAATSRALSVFNELSYLALNDVLVGSLSDLKTSQPAYQTQVHAIYNPLGITQYNIVPGLLGVVLTMTLVIVTALAITREQERGTMENLLATPCRPIEVMLGKIFPYIIVGYIQMSLIIVAAKLLFAVPTQGSILLLFILSLPFIAANLAVGLTFSTLAKNQLQAVQGAMFFFLPSILLSGFMFPFRGMPDWAQVIGNCLPLTHYLVIVRGILLKGNGFLTVWPQLIPIFLFAFVILGIGLKRYRQTLD